MSEVTTCPSCATSFRVVPDLLRISEGWVRCGKCAEVFDANAALHQADDSSLTDGQAARPEKVTLLDRADDAAPEAVATKPTSAASDPERSQSLVETPIQDRIEPSLEPEAALPPPPSFLHSDGDKPKRSKASTVMLAVLLVLTVLALMLQMIYQERDRIAAMFPRSHPLLTMACASMGCMVSPVKQIESVVIEASSFNRVRAENYRLVVTLRNAAHVEVALPALDLALTDSADQVVMRKVLLPQEFAPGTGVLAAGAEWSGQVSMQIRPITAAEKFTGYRLYAFYP